MGGKLLIFNIEGINQNEITGKILKLLIENDIKINSAFQYDLVSPKLDTEEIMDEISMNVSLDTDQLNMIDDIINKGDVEISLNLDEAYIRLNVNEILNSTYNDFKFTEEEIMSITRNIESEMNNPEGFGTLLSFTIMQEIENTVRFNENNITVNEGKNIKYAFDRITDGKLLNITDGMRLLYIKEDEIDLDELFFNSIETRLEKDLHLAIIENNINLDRPVIRYNRDEEDPMDLMDIFMCNEFYLEIHYGINGIMDKVKLSQLAEGIEFNDRGEISDGMIIELLDESI